MTHDIDEFTIQNQNTTAGELLEYLEALQEQGFDLSTLPIHTPQTDPKVEQDLHFSLYAELLTDDSMVYDLKAELVEVPDETQIDGYASSHYRNSEGDYGSAEGDFGHELAFTTNEPPKESFHNLEPVNRDVLQELVDCYTFADKGDTK